MRTLALLAFSFLFAVPLKADGPVDQSLVQSFPGAEVAKAPIKLAQKEQHLIIAGSDLQFLTNSRVRMTNCYLIRTGSGDKTELKAATAIRSDAITFQMDRPIKSIREFSGKRFVSAELADGSTLSFESK